MIGQPRAICFALGSLLAIFIPLGVWIIECVFVNHSCCIAHTQLPHAPQTELFCKIALKIIRLSVWVIDMNMVLDSLSRGSWRGGARLRLMKAL